MGRLAALELAVFVSEPSELERAVREPIAGVLPSRLYFGNEFCERLLMTEEQLRAATRLAADAGLGLTVVFPYLSPKPFERAERLLALLAELSPGAEVACNDWGVLRRVAADERLVPVMGRCLNRTLCDPRLPEHVGGALPPGALAALRGGPFASPEFERFASRYRVARVELDEPPLGLDSGLAAGRVARSLHHPFAFVASGRVCLFAAVGRRDDAAVGERFTPGPCAYECREYELDLSAPPALAGRLAVVQRGNTVFVRHAAVELPALISRCEGLVDRVVWSSAAPMGGGPCA